MARTLLTTGVFLFYFFTVVSAFKYFCITHNPVDFGMLKANALVAGVYTAMLVMELRLRKAEKKYNDLVEQVNQLGSDSSGGGKSSSPAS